MGLRLSVVIPMRVTNAREDLIERMGFFKYDTRLPEGIEFIVVDDGSPPKYLERIHEKAMALPVKVLSTGRKHYQQFSFAIARNYGAQRASGEFVLFLDADLVPYPGFFSDLLREAEFMNMKQQAQNFLMCPVLYLSDHGWSQFNNMNEDDRRPFFIGHYLRGDSPLIEKYSTGTSAIMLRRDYFLARGGNDTEFNGWGFEDYEFANRLIRRARMFPLPEDWLDMNGNFMTVSEFKGWKSVYRLHGDWLAQKGIWLVHAPHPIDGALHYNKMQNWNLLQQRMKTDASDGESEPPPLADLTVGRSLLMARNPFCYGRDIVPYLGESIFASEGTGADIQSFEQLLGKLAIDRVVFANPYKDKANLAAYNWCRKNKFPMLVCERGALPDSVFHDRNGFLCDSDSYAASKWERPLMDEETKAVETYIQSIRFGGQLLEQQSARMDLHIIRRKLGVKPTQKILLVPFQQPKDSVIQYFAGPIGGFAEFYDLVSDLPLALGSEWRVIYKKHPVEDGLAPINGAIDGSAFNIYDLVELADAMLLINSGTGIYGMMFGKPVYIVGQCWYADQRMNMPIANLSTVADTIKGGFSIDYDRILCFIHYLRFEYYSFGIQTQRRVRYEDGSPITATTDIKYYELRGFSPETLFINRAPKPIPRKSPLFDRYQNSTGEKQRINSSPTENKNATTQTSAPVKAKHRLPKLTKLRRDPQAFFRDSHVRLLRPLRYLFTSKVVSSDAP